LYRTEKIEIENENEKAVESDAERVRSDSPVIAERLSLFILPI